MIKSVWKTSLTMYSEHLYFTYMKLADCSQCDPDCAADCTWLTLETFCSASPPFLDNYTSLTSTREHSFDHKVAKAIRCERRNLRFSKPVFAILFMLMIYRHLGIRVHVPECAYCGECVCMYMCARISVRVCMRAYTGTNARAKLLTQLLYVGLSAKLYYVSLCYYEPLTSK